MLCTRNFNNHLRNEWQHSLGSPHSVISICTEVNLPHHQTETHGKVCPRGVKECIHSDGKQTAACRTGGEGREQWGVRLGEVRGNATRTNFTFALILFRAKPERNTAGKWDTELTTSHLCLWRALTLTQKRWQWNKEELQGENKLARSLGHRESSPGAPNRAGHGIEPPPAA